jgi:hypothetical protein
MMNMGHFRTNILTRFLLLSLGIMSCQTASQTEEVVAHWPLTIVESPAVRQSGDPNLFVAEDGRLFLSWIDQEADYQHGLRFAKWENEGWSAAQTIAQNSNWFVNWADFPSLAVHEDFMVAHWLAKSAGGTYDYDAKVTLSQDMGQNWSEPFVLHRDGIPAEHGFVTLLPLQPNKMFAVWLDGPATASLYNQVAVAWYTAAEEKPKVQLALSENNGADFGAPIRLDHGNPLGRADAIFLDDKHLMVSWMESNGKSADIRAAVVSKSGEILSDRVLVATAASRSSGFPIMEKADEHVFFTWTEVGEEQTQVKTGKLNLNEILQAI